MRHQALEQFTHIISHTLKAPVANILGICNLFEFNNMKKDELNELRNMLRACSINLDSVFSDLNSILNPEVYLDTQKEFVFFADVLNGVKHQLSHDISMIDTEIVENFQKVPGVVSVKDYLEKILCYLLRASIKRNESLEKLTIFIDSYIRENKIFLCIRDNGVSIEIEDTASSVFTLYRRYHEGINGKGLGVITAKSFVEALGGKMMVRSMGDVGIEVLMEFPT